MSSLSSDASQHKISTKILCLVVFFTMSKSFSPLLSYTVPYLVHVKGLTNFQVTNKIFPVLSYGTLAFTVLAAPACEYASYKTIIILGSTASLLGVVLLRFGNTLLSLQIMEILSSCGAASYFVFQAYLFFLVTENHFQTLTSINQATVSASLFLSAELGQILVLIGIQYNNILYITMAAATLTCILGLLLPKEQHQRDETQPFLLNIFSQDQGLWSIIKETWNDKRLQLLSVWWAAALAGFELSLNYGTSLFEAIDIESTFNGQVIAVATALGVIVSLTSVYLAKAAAKIGGSVYILGSVTFGALCLGLAYTRTIWVAYLIYVAMVGLEKLMICFVYAQCGGLVKNARYALMFSFNTGLGQLTMVVIQALIEIAKLDIFSEYIALGSYFIVVALLFSIPYGLHVWREHTLVIISSDDVGEFQHNETKSVYQPLTENGTPPQDGTS